MKIGEFDPSDRKFWPSKPEPGFSVERNKRIIEESIKKYDRQVARKMNEFTNRLQERTDAVATYLTGDGGAQRSRSVEKYFGKTNLAYLRGEDIKSKLVQQRSMTLKTPLAEFNKKVEQKEIAKKILSGKGVSKIKRTINEQKPKKRTKKI